MSRKTFAEYMFEGPGKCLASAVVVWEMGKKLKLRYSKSSNYICKLVGANGEFVKMVINTFKKL